jgi:hypothetical protein
MSKSGDSRLKTKEEPEGSCERQSAPAAIRYEVLFDLLVYSIEV